MKVVLVIILFFSLNESFFSQSKKKENISNFKEIFRLSRKFNDNDVAKYACYLLIEDEGQLSNYKDSLAAIYMEEKNYNASLTLSNELLQNKASNFALKINAYSLKGLNNFQEANLQFNKLIKVEKLMSTCYELAYTEWKLGDYQSALSTIDYAFALHVNDVKQVEFIDNSKITLLNLNDALNLIRIKIYQQSNDKVNLTKTLLLIENEALSKMLLNGSETSKSN